MAPDEKVNLLLVDDQVGKLLSYEAILADLGQNLVKAGSAREALEHLLKMDFAVVLIDVCMPGMDGFELAELIRGHPRCRRTAIILISAILMTDLDRLRGYDTGAVDYVSVPLVPELLRAKVNVFIDLYRKTALLEDLNRDLETRVAQRTRDLEASNARLVESEERFRLATEALAGGIYEWDVAGGVVERSAGLVELLGYGGEGVEENLVWWSERVHPGDAAAREHAIAAALESDARTYNTEYRIRHRNGGWVWIRDRGRLVRDNDGRAVRIVGHITDISARKGAEDALRVADRRKDEFLAMLAHELRNPLAPIRNAVDYMMLKNLPDPHLEWARGVIERQVAQMARLLDDLLDIARVTSGKLTLRAARLDLESVFRAAVETSRPIMDASGQELVVEIPPQPIPLDGDLTRLDQIVSNLLNNAAKYTPRGGRIRLSAQRMGDEVVVSVRDNGIGIAPEMLPHVFELFSQVDLPREERQGGLGVGLALTKRLVEMHGGTIAAASGGPGKGSEFTVRLPIAQGEPAAPPPASEAVRPVAPDVSRRILVVDDRPDAADTLGVLLRMLGHEIRTANEGREALRVAGEFLPEVVLLDIGMPGMNGYEVAQALRRMPGLAGAVLVAITGYGQEVDKARSKEAGIDHHLVKPVDPAFLQLLLTAGIGQTAAPRAGRA